MTEYLPQSFTHNHLAPLDLSSSKIESTTDLSSSSWQQAYPYPFYGDPLWSAQGNGGTVDFGDLESHGAMGISPSLLANIQEEDETGQPKQEDKVSQLPGSYDLEDPSLLNSSPFGTTFSDAGDGGDGGEEVDKEKGPEFWNRFDHEKSDTRSIPIPPITVVPSSNPFATRGRAKRGEQSSKSTPASTAATTTTTVTSTKRTNTTTRKSKGVTSAGVRKYQGGRRTEIDDMITRVMSRFNNSLKALTAKADKTQEEKEVGRILGNRDAAHLSRRKKNETITSLKSTNASLSLKLYQSQQSVQALTKMNEVQEKRMRLLEERYPNDGFGRTSLKVKMDDEQEGGDR
ncbi:hypothetical protein L202_05703 [Cryptococcus amylolentus CBS 6039]|uniref:BZIP domain-containing protein n=1 Tax=Cryptococcus amylolentus CBS 6039 TaxID=1295533 RepID=A0A1E3HLG2_9TREE|nr:hypothetical protein L202_05703 [Cryptococcus amylolentus CBS 6039]ODN77179.1 hypothetical protein L202_05703 [Cryptococcus amylolentus CBS 6039]